MSLIGGYYNLNAKKIDRREILSKIEKFKCLTNELSNDDEIVLREYEYGHLFTKGKKGVRSMLSFRQDRQGNILLSLGYTNIDGKDAFHSEIDAEIESLGEFPKVIFDAEGEFVSIYFEKVSKRLHIINDRFAARPFYFLKTQNTVFFCSNIILLIRLCDYDCKFNPEGLLQIFNYSHTIGDCTHIAGIKRLTPSCHMTVTNKDVVLKSYWKLRYEPEYNIDPDWFAKTVFLAFEKGVKTRANLMRPGYLNLSGGLDSRLIAATLQDQCPFVTFSLAGDTQNKEYCVAAQVAKSLGHQHLNIIFSPGIISDNASDLVMLTGGLVPFHHLIKPLHRLPDYDIHMSGGPGDVLVGSYVPDLSYTQPSQANEIIKKHTIVGNKAVCERFFQKAILSTYIPILENSLRESFYNVLGPTAAHTISAWKMVYRQPAFTFSNPHHNHPYSTQIRPHLDYSYNDLILKLPAMWLYQKQFYQYLIYSCLPQLRNIVYANTGRRLSGRIGSTQLSPVTYAISLFNSKLHFKLLKVKNRFFSINRQPIEFVSLKEDEKLLERLPEILLSYNYLREILIVDNCIKFIKDFKEGRNEDNFSRPEDQLGFLATIAYFYHYNKMNV